MHPALSLIFFTVASGAGFGLIGACGMLAAFGAAPGSRWFAVLALGLGLGTVTIGLLSSVLHLRRKARARFAFSQWRSSWLSREAVLALATVAIAGLFGLWWLIANELSVPVRVLGGVAALFALATVIATGMIYASLKTVRQWHHPMTVPLFVLMAGATGLAMLCLALALFGALGPRPVGLAMLLLLVTWALKPAYWRTNDFSISESTAESATGLGALGAVRLLDPPHTGSSYLLDEMGYKVARKHAEKLRIVAIVAGGIAPIALYALAIVWTYAGPVAWLLCLLAAACALLGALVERWLFFAEATHTVTLYYGAKTA
ncbi:MAG: dimethyl sulfoxide reductase anchor subunit family protein [Alphaproteobacteria bacterium]